MPQLNIYLDGETARRLEEEARRQGQSRSAIAAQAIRRALGNRFSDEWLALGGSWKDDRTVEEIMRDIRSGPEQRSRVEFD